MECSECERNFRAGHDPKCSRYQADFQIPVTYEANGYVTVRARNSVEAKRKLRVQSEMVRLDFDNCDINNDMLPDTPTLIVTGDPVMIEPEEDC